MLTHVRYCFAAAFALALALSATAQEGLPGLDEEVTDKAFREALVSEAVLIVYGTGGDEVVTAELKQFATELKAELEGKMSGAGWPITLRPDSEVSLPELGGCALFLVGTPSSNVILTLYEGSFPLQVAADGVTVGKETVQGADVAATFAVINPFNPGHYAVVYTGVNDAAIYNAPDFAFDEIGYVVVNGAGVQARGQFDTTIPEYWTVLPGASVKSVSAQLVADTTALGADLALEEPVAGIADASVFLLGYGPEDGTAEIPALLMPYLLHLSEHRGVRVVGLQAPRWLGDYLDAYVVDGTAPPDGLTVPEEIQPFVEALRAHNNGLARDQRIHVATFDLNHGVFEGSQSLLPLQVWIDGLRDRETRKSLGKALDEARAAYEGGNPAAMLQGINRLNEGVAVAALKKKLPAELYPVLRRYLDTEKTSIFYHQPETRARRGTPPVLEARARVMRQNMTDILAAAEAEYGSPVLFFAAADHCNKGAPGAGYGRISLAQYFDKYYEPTWEKVHSVVAFAYSGRYFDHASGAALAIDGGFTPDEFEALVADFRKPNSVILVDFSDPFWVDNRLPIGHVWTWPAELYDGMIFLFDVTPTRGKKLPVGQ